MIRVNTFKRLQTRLFSSSIVRLNSTNTANVVNPSLVQFKVGFIEEIDHHPNADKLYVSKIRHSAEQTVEPYTVCSGLVGYVDKESLLHSKVILVTNLKPSKMRGIKSEAMLLAADKESQVEVVTPPLDSTVGDELFFKPFVPTTSPSRIKPKTWDMIQQKLSTDHAGRVVYTEAEGDSHFLTTRTGTEPAHVRELTLAAVH